jgi:DHA2 family multidrug resistance protein
LTFVPLTAVTLACVDPDETESAAGLQNFLRTLSAAIGASIVQTAWEDKAIYAHAELSGLAGKGPGAGVALDAAGLSPGQAILILNRLVDSESVMIATNQVMTLVALAFVGAAITICLSPRPPRQLDPMASGH